MSSGFILMASPGPNQSPPWQIESQPDNKETGEDRHYPIFPSIAVPKSSDWLKKEKKPSIKQEDLGENDDGMASKNRVNGEEEEEEEREKSTSWT